MLDYYGISKITVKKINCLVSDAKMIQIFVWYADQYSKIGIFAILFLILTQ